MKTNFIIWKHNFIVLLLCFPSLLFGQKKSTLQQHKETLRQYFESVVNKHDLTKYKTFFASNFIWHTMDGKEIHSEKDSSHIATLRIVFTAIPDIYYSIEHIIIENDIIAVNTKVTGTAKSEYFGFSPALKKVEFRQMFFFRLLNKKIIEEWEVLDMDRIKETLSKK